jgi:hypothetical protein
MLFVRANRHNDGAAALEELFDFDPCAMVQKHVRSSFQEDG